MATEDSVKRIVTQAQSILSYDRPDMIRRDKWGSSIDFTDAKLDFDRAFFIGQALSAPEVSIVAESDAAQLSEQLSRISSALEAINVFKVEEGGGMQRRNEAIHNLRRSTEGFIHNWANWLVLVTYHRKGFDSHQKAVMEAARNAGDNVKLINEALQRANSAILAETEKAKATLKEIQREREQVIAAAMKFSAEVAAAGQRTAYSTRVGVLENAARKWLYACVTLALSTLIAAVIVWGLSPAQGTLAKEFLPSLGPKMVVLALFFTATVWCGRNYRALQHEASIYAHRSVALDVFPVMLAATPDKAKEVVIVEAARSLFASSASAWSHDSDHKLVEIVQSGLPRGNP